MTRIILPSTLHSNTKTSTIIDQLAVSFITNLDANGQLGIQCVCVCVCVNVYSKHFSTTKCTSS